MKSIPLNTINASPRGHDGENFSNHINESAGSVVFVLSGFPKLIQAFRELVSHVSSPAKANRVSNTV